MKNPRARRFEYQPRFYHPEEEQDENEPRIRFKRLTRRKTVPKRSPIVLVVLILILFFLIRYLHNLTEAEKQNRPVQDIKIEIID
jgi:hypothetical protein